MTGLKNPTRLEKKGGGAIRIRISLVAGFLAVALLSSCSTMTASISARSVGGFRAGTKVSVQRADPKAAKYDFAYQNYAHMVSRFLERNGAVVVTKGNDFDQVVYLSYSIGSPVSSTVNSPVFGQVPTGESTTTGVIRPAGRNALSLDMTTTQNTRLGVTGYQSNQVTSFLRMVSLNAFDAKKVDSDGDPILLWQLSVGSYGETSDLSVVFPYLLYAAEGTVGKNYSRVFTRDIAITTNTIRYYD